MEIVTKQSEGKEELLQQEKAKSALIKELAYIMARNYNEQFLRNLLTRARNIENILNKM